MKKIKITVIRKARYDDLIARYENPIDNACDMVEDAVFIALSLFSLRFLFIRSPDFRTWGRSLFPLSAPHRRWRSAGAASRLLLLPEFRRRFAELATLKLLIAFRTIFHSYSSLIYLLDVAIYNDRTSLFNFITDFSIYCLILCDVMISSAHCINRQYMSSFLLLYLP